MGKVGWRVSICLCWFPHSFFQIYLIWALRSRFLFHWSCVCGSSSGVCFCVSWRVVRNKSNWSSWIFRVLCGIVPGHPAEFGKISHCVSIFSQLVVIFSLHVHLKYILYKFAHHHSVHFILPSQVLCSEIFHSSYFVLFSQLIQFCLLVSYECHIFPNRTIILLGHYIHLCCLKLHCFFFSILLLKIHISFTLAPTSHLVFPASCFFLLNIALWHWVSFQSNYH